MTKLKEILKGPTGKLAVAGSLVVMLIASGFVVAGKKKTVTLAYDGKTEVVTTYKETVEGLLEGEELTLDKKDKVSHTLDTNIEDNMKISIKRAVPINVEDAGKVTQIKTSADTVSDMLSEEKIALGKIDKVSPAATEAIKPNMKVDITRVEEKTQAVNEVLPFAVKKEVDKSLKPGQTKVVKEGEVGRRETIYKSTYEDGKEVAKVKVTERIASKPVAKMIAEGPAKPKESVQVASRGGRAMSYKKEMTMTATAYSQAPYDPQGGGSITASGRKVKRDPNGVSTVAVDPKVIPLGTKLYIEGYGHAIAADTGGAIKGNKIDLYFNPGAEYESFGKRKVKVYVL